MVQLASKQDAINAAKVLPSNRTTEQQALIDSNTAYVEVRNADFDAKRYEKAHGAK